jgi:hypothetical protein
VRFRRIFYCIHSFSNLLDVLQGQGGRGEEGRREKEGRKEKEGEGKVRGEAQGRGLGCTR